MDASASLWWAELAWVGHLAEGVAIELDGEKLVSLQEGVVTPPAGAYRLDGLTIPGLANAHSHAFQRALRARVDAGGFWSWREEMYRLAATLEPETYYRLARATFAEMTLAGVAAVGEFHYLHHRTDGSPYQDPNAMGRSLIRAAEEAGLRMTLIDTCYLRGGFDQPAEGVQVRFSDGEVAAWETRVTELGNQERLRLAAGVHSVRAVDPLSVERVASWAHRRAAPLHVHVSEQAEENRASLRAVGLTPTELLAETGALGPLTTAVHATHLTEADIGLLGRNAAGICLCPTTERDLGDGIGPASRLAEAGCRLCVGSDGHMVIDLFEEARLVELHQRLVNGRRGHHRAQDLLEAATASGMAALGWASGRLEPGLLADFITVGLSSPRLAGATPDRLIDQLVWAASAADVTHLVVGGRLVVENGKHLALGDVGVELQEAIAMLGQ